MGQIQGSSQNVEIDVTGGTSYKNLVCLSTSSANLSMDTSTTQTNCGVLTSPGITSMTIDFDAVCEASPTVGQVSYSDLQSAMVNQTLIAVAYSNTGYVHEFHGYVTALSISQSTTDFIKFNGTISSTGNITI